MTRIQTLIALIADAALTVAIGFGVPLLIATAGWLTTGGFQETDWIVPVTGATVLWALGLGGGVGFTIEPSLYPGLGIGEPFSFVVSVAPLAFTAFIAWMAWRAGARLSEEDEPWTGLGGSVVAFALASWLSLSFADAHPVRVDVLGSVVVGTLIWLVLMLIGLRVWELLPWRDWLGDLTDLVFWHAGRVARVAAGFVVGTFALASLLLLVALIAGMGRVMGLQQALQLGVWDAIALGLVQLAYVPTMLVWAMSWLLGPGIQLGAGSHAGFGGTDAGPLPIVPLLGLVPEGGSGLWWAFIALPVALAAVISLLVRAQDAGIDSRVWWERLIAPIGGAVVSAVVLAVLAQLARGSLGPGRLTEFGPQPWWVLLAAFLILAIGGAAGAFLPLEPVVRVVGASNDQFDDSPETWYGYGSRDEPDDGEAQRGSGDVSSGDEGSGEHNDDSAHPTRQRHGDAHPGTAAHRIPLQLIIGRGLRQLNLRGGSDRSESSDVAEPNGDDDDAVEKPRIMPRGPSRQAPKTGLGDALNRPGEPDIYRDLD